MRSLEGNGDRQSKRIAAVLPCLLTAMAVVVAAPAHAAAEDALPMFLADYATIHEALAADKTTGVPEAAAKIAERADQTAKGASQPALYQELAKSAKAMTGADIADLREKMKPLSVAMAALVDAAGTKEAGFYYCPMAGGYWLQKKGDEALRNPYYGAEMLTCGSKVEKVYADDEEGG